MDFFDYQIIILWNSNSDLSQIIEEKFHDCIIVKKTMQFSKEERLEKVRGIYAPYTIHEDDTRAQYSEPITLFMIRLRQKYKYYFRSEGYRLCNPNILEFKLENRKNHHFNVFHCSDNINETRDALKVFNLEEYMPPCRIIHINDLYHYIHQDTDSYFDAYQNAKYKIVPVKDAPVVKYLMGYKDEYLNGSKTFAPRESTIKYLQSLSEPFNQSYDNCVLTVYKKDDKYIITDGQHRSGMLYFQGDRHIFIHEEIKPQLTNTSYNYLLEKNNSKKLENSHIENLNELIFRLNNVNIKYVIIRGWHKLPYTANTDLDIVVHPNDFPRFLEIMNNSLKEGLISSNGSKKYSNPNHELWYYSYRTNGIFGDNIINNCFQLDVYNHAFFFASDTEGVTVSWELLENMMEHRVKKLNFYTPNIWSELVLLICRTNIDKRGIWAGKHMYRALELMKVEEFKKPNFINFFHMASRGDLEQYDFHLDQLIIDKTNLPILL